MRATGKPGRTGRLSRRPGPVPAGRTPRPAANRGARGATSSRRLPSSLARASSVAATERAHLDRDPAMPTLPSRYCFRSSPSGVVAPSGTRGCRPRHEACRRSRVRRKVVGEGQRIHYRHRYDPSVQRPTVMSERDREQRGGSQTDVVTKTRAKTQNRLFTRF